MKKKYIISILVIAILLTSTIVYFIYHNKNKTYIWKTSPVKQGNITIIVKATGTVNADTTVQVGTQVTGTIWKLYADFNTIVKKGQVITVLDTTFLSASRIDAQATLDKAQAQYDQAKRDNDRNMELYNEKVLSRSDYETTLTALATAKSAVTSAKAQLNHAIINLQYAVIRAPVNGVVISRNVDLGQTVVSSFNSVTLFSIANDLTKMQVQASVDEADIGECKVGQRVTFTVDAFPDEIFKGEISQIRLQPVIVQNVVNYTVIIEVLNPDLKLMPGLTANININVQEHENILKIPSNSLNFMPPAEYIASLKTLSASTKAELNMTTSPSSSENYGATSKKKSFYIWIKKGENIYPEKVKLGLSDGTYTEVTGEIKQGDEVATGEVSSAKGSGQTSKSPFMPQFPGRK